MQFKDSETQKLLRDAARSFLAGAYPYERLYRIERGDERINLSDVKAFSDLGWMGLLAPETATGGGASLLEAAAVVEEFGAAAVTGPVPLSNAAAYVLGQAARTDGVQECLDHLSEGKRIYTVSEATRRRGRSRPGGGGGAAPALVSSGRSLRGVLPLVPFADLAEFVVAPLTLDGEPAVAVLPLAAARVEPVDLLDLRPTFTVSFDGSTDGLVVLGRDAQGEQLHELLDAVVTALGLIELVGRMQRVLEMTSEYIGTRVQFGRPVATFQAARHRAAEMLMRVESSRWAAYHALWQMQENTSNTNEVWLAKHWAIRGAEVIFRNSHMLHGGIGVGVEYPLHLYTQGIAAGIVRGGDMPEMVARISESIAAEQARAGMLASPAEPVAVGD